MQIKDESKSRPPAGADLESQLGQTRNSSRIAEYSALRRPLAADLSEKRPWTIRRATIADAELLRAMHRSSFLHLGKSFYSPRQIDGFLNDFDTADPTMIADGTYGVLEACGTILASGGWTLRTPAYAAPNSSATDDQDTAVRATIRGVFTRPGHERRGLARSILKVCEDEAVRLGRATNIDLYATLAAVPFYLNLAYQPGEAVEVPLSNGECFTARFMTKSVAPVVHAAP